MANDGKPDYAMLRDLYEARNRIDPSASQWMPTTTREQAELNETLFQAGFKSGWDAALSRDNVKQVSIAAEINYNYYEDEEMAQFMAFIQSPACGFEVHFKNRKNHDPLNGRRMITYEIYITGSEAVRDTWLETFGKVLARNSNPLNGPVLRWRDKENDMSWQTWKPDMALSNATR